MLTFDPEQHLYRWHGSPVPGVTSLLAPLIDYSFVREEVLAMAAERGHTVHKLTELYDLDDLDESSVDPRLMGYLDAWKRFREEQQFVPTFIEKPLYHPVHGYAGTPDRFGLLKSDRVTLDVKTVSRLMPATAVQTAAYQHLGHTNGHATESRVAVQLQPDGQYRMKRYRDPNDWATFLSLFTVHNWKKANGV